MTYYNGFPALLGGFLVAISMMILFGFDLLPGLDRGSRRPSFSMWCVRSGFLVITLLWRSQNNIFLDRICISQQDNYLEAQAIFSLAGYANQVAPHCSTLQAGNLEKLCLMGKASALPVAQHRQISGARTKHTGPDNRSLQRLRAVEAVFTKSTTMKLRKAAKSSNLMLASYVRCPKK